MSKYCSLTFEKLLFLFFFQNDILLEKKNLSVSCELRATMVLEVPEVDCASFGKLRLSL